MYTYSLLLLLSAFSFSTALVSLRRAENNIGQSCSTKSDGSGTCQDTSDCTTTGFHEAGFCPGPDNIQCCVKKTCSTSSGSGTCLNKGSSDNCKGTFVPGACPGPDSIQCCVTDASPSPSSSPSPTPSPGPPSLGSGQPIVDAAEKEKGLPYVWGGGGCDGPSKGGFDCSGLTQYALCQAGHGTIPRTAQTQYHADKGKHLPRAEAKPGDLIFWGEGGDCVNNVVHVGIFKSEGKMVNAAHTGTPVREQDIWTSSGGESICDDAVRFW